MDERGGTTLFLTGDVMTGRGIDQVLPRPCDPRIYEGYMKSAVGYVSLAEEAHGPIPRPVDFDYVWGEVLPELDRRRPDVRLINLETAVTTSGDAEPKGINYRMNPGNAPVIAAAAVDCCVLANNHVLDWGEAGLRETLRTLDHIRVATAGAGLDREQAERPAALTVPGGRVLVFAVATPTAGVPRDWAAARGRPGVDYVPDLDDAAVRSIAQRVRRHQGRGDVVVVSIHWGANWGYDIPERQRRFARRLVEEAGVDIVWGHSSHHPKGIEVHKGRLILYGCGDFLNDYEGISGHERFRDDLVLMYLPEVGAADGALRELRLVPFQIRRFRLQRASEDDAQWLADVLTREGEAYDTRVAMDTDGTLVLEWDEVLC